MANEVELPPQQFRLSTILVGLTIGCVAFAVLRHLPPPRNGFSPLHLTSGVMIWALNAASVWVLCRNAEKGGPLLAGAIGTLGGGSSFGAAVIAYEGEPQFATEVMIIASIVGGVWALVFLVFGAIAAGVWSIVINRDSASTGVICGGVTGFLSLFVIAQSEPPRLMVIDCMYPALVGGLFGGFGSAVQMASAKQRRRERAARLAALGLDELPETIPTIDSVDDSQRNEVVDSNLEKS